MLAQSPQLVKHLHRTWWRTYLEWVAIAGEVVEYAIFECRCITLPLTLAGPDPMLVAVLSYAVILPAMLGEQCRQVASIVEVVAWSQLSRHMLSSRNWPRLALA